MWIGISISQQIIQSNFGGRTIWIVQQQVKSEFILFWQSILREVFSRVVCPFCRRQTLNIYFAMSVCVVAFTVVHYHEIERNQLVNTEWMKGLRKFRFILHRTSYHTGRLKRSQFFHWNSGIRVLLKILIINPKKYAISLGRDIHMDGVFSSFQ